MAKQLYLECFSGISGDMTVGALIDLGIDENLLLEGLKSLNVPGYIIKIKDTIKQGIKSKKFDVIIDNENENHTHRHLKNIKEIIDSSRISKNAKDMSIKMFSIVAQAEAKVHGKSIEDVHFHEVGAIDSIVDIVAVSICLDLLQIDEVFISSLYEGSGHVKCAHGMMPVPVPAVIAIGNKYGLDFIITENKGEMITPTGAAIAACLNNNRSLPSKFKINKIGVGAGTKDFIQANILRAMLIETSDATPGEDTIISLSCNVDDMTGEELGFGIETIMINGALDAYFIPTYMKKNRPSYIFTVLCEENIIEEMKYLIFKHTSTLGIRIQSIKRVIMERTFESFKSSLGEVTIKIAKYKDIEKTTIEYEDARKLAIQNNMSLDRVFEIIYGEIVSD